jgi:hypothetical protein
MEEAYSEVRHILLGAGMDLEYLFMIVSRIVIVSGFRPTNLSLKSFIEYMNDLLQLPLIDERIQNLTSSGITREQYEWLLLNHRDLLTSENDLSVYRIKYFPDTRLFTLAPEDQLNLEMVITRESAPFFTVDRLQKMMDLSDKVRRNAKKWVYTCIFKRDYMDDEIAEDVMKCSDLYAISMFLPFMPLDVIRHVRSIRKSPHHLWIWIQATRRFIDRRFIRRLAFCCGLEDWYRDQEWMSLNYIMHRMDDEIRERFIPHHQSPDDSDEEVEEDDSNQDPDEDE